jgi:hypothetical protein
MDRFYELSNGMIIDLDQIVAVSPKMQPDTFNVITNSNTVKISIDPAGLEAQRAALIDAWKAWKDQ